MKAGWVTKTLGDICEIQRGGSPRPISSFLTNASDGINWIKIGDTKNVTKYITETEEKIRPEGAKRSRMVFDGDFVLSNSMSFGRPYIMKTTGCIHDGWLVLRPLEPRINQDYLYHVLGSDLIFRQFDRLAAGSTVRNLNIGLVKGVEIPVPSPSEQQRIVGVLDEAFDRIATARANSEKNVQNARALFESHLQSLFELEWKRCKLVPLSELATDITDGDHLPPPKSASGVPFITIGNIDKQTRTIDFTDTFMVPHEYFNRLKMNRRPNRGDVLYTVTGSFGIPVIVPDDFKFCFQRHIALVRPKPGTQSAWLYYLLSSPQVLVQAIDGATGTAQKTVSLKVLRGLTVPQVPLDQQKSMIAKLNALSEETQRLESIYQRKLSALEELKKSLLHQAFTGQLTQEPVDPVLGAFPARIANITSTDLHAGILAMAYQLHEKNNRHRYFGHVKGEKIAHMVEAHLGIDLGRAPVKDAAGPNDYPHLKNVEYRAKMAGFFLFQESGGSGYRIVKYRNFDSLIDKTTSALAGRNQDVEGLLKLMLPMTTQHAEVISTVYAAWNNLLLDGQPITDEKIVFEARENWHPAKLNIPRENFFSTIRWMRKKKLIPQGRGRRVGKSAKETEK